MRRIRSIVAATLACALVAACGASDDHSGDTGDAESGDDNDAVGSPGLDLVAHLEPDDATAVGASITAFGFDLLSELADGTENVIISPLSAATMLSLALAGAGGDTADAMAEALHLADPHDVRSGALLESLTGADDVTLSVANALWADPDLSLEPGYVDVATDILDAAIETGDLAAQDTADAIDDWVVEHTEGLIEGVSEDLRLPNPAAVLVLLNAVYFLGEWTTQFDPDQTWDAPFTRADGSSVDVPLMQMRNAEFGYAVRPGYRMLRLPYGEDERFGMEIILPDTADGLPEVVGRLDADEWRAAVTELATAELDEVAVPRFELHWDGELTDALVALGMGPAFGPGADFTAMSPSAPWLNSVVHKTYLRVDEEGTEAAAVTAGDMVTSMPADTLTFRVDRPFAFTISDRDTGTVLFTGTVTDPLEG